MTADAMRRAEAWRRIHAEEAPRGGARPRRGGHRIGARSARVGARGGGASARAGRRAVLSGRVRRRRCGRRPRFAPGHRPAAGCAQHRSSLHDASTHRRSPAAGRAPYDGRARLRGLAYIARRSGRRRPGGGDRRSRGVPVRGAARRVHRRVAPRLAARSRIPDDGAGPSRWRSLVAEELHHPGVQVEHRRDDNDASAVDQILQDWACLPQLARRRQRVGAHGGGEALPAIGRLVVDVASRAARYGRRWNAGSSTPARRAPARPPSRRPRRSACGP